MGVVESIEVKARLEFGQTDMLKTSGKHINDKVELSPTQRMKGKTKAKCIIEFIELAFLRTGHGHNDLCPRHQEAQEPAVSVQYHACSLHDQELQRGEDQDRGLDRELLDWLPDPVSGSAYTLQCF